MKLLALLLVLAPCFAHAGYYEIGLSGNYRKLNLPTNTGRESFDATTSFTGSFSYYFAEMAAAELSYTQGQSERFIPSTTADSRTLYDFALVGFDIVFTFAERKDPFIPYLKAGVAYFAKKEVTYEYIDNVTLGNNANTESLPKTFVPSVGMGIKLKLSNTFAIKIGIEGWTSDSIDKDPRWDLAGRAGISWFL